VIFSHDRGGAEKKIRNLRVSAVNSFVRLRLPAENSLHSICVVVGLWPFQSQFVLTILKAAQARLWEVRKWKSK
jgi:hypothetical protein